MKKTTQKTKFRFGQEFHGKCPSRVSVNLFFSFFKLVKIETVFCIEIQSAFDKRYS